MSPMGENSTQKVTEPGSVETKPQQTKVVNPKKSFRKLLKPLLIVCLIIVIGMAVWFAIQYFTQWPYKTLTTNGTTYSFRFSKSAKPVTIENDEYMQGEELNSSNIINVTFQKSPAPTDCSTLETLKKEFDVTVKGTTYPVCSTDYKQLRISRFQIDDTWYVATIFPEDNTTAPDQATVQKIISSVKVL